MAIYTGSNKHLGGTEKITQKHKFYYGLVQKNVLITGANGQLGNELRERHEMDNNIFHFVYTDVDILDITDLQQVSDFIKEKSISYIINCAAYTNVEKAEDDAEAAYLINYKGAENLAKAAAENDCRMIHISTDFVFDGQSTTPYIENSLANPLSVYGASKLKGEEAVRQFAKEWMIIRTSWLYSEFGNNFVKTMIRLMTERDKLNIVADQHGTPTYAADLAEMIVHILDFSEEKEWKTGVYHFSNLGETTWFGFAEKIKELAYFEECSLNPVTTQEYGAKAERPLYSVLDKSKISSDFHVEIPSWENGLVRCLNKLLINNY